MSDSDDDERIPAVPSRRQRSSANGAPHTAPAARTAAAVSVIDEDVDDGASADVEEVETHGLLRPHDAVASVPTAVKPPASRCRWTLWLTTLCVAASILAGGLGSTGAAAAFFGFSTSPFEPVRAAAADPRSYRLLTLPNGLKLLLVHDPEATLSSAAVDVGVGSLHDPRDWPGLAHGVEHGLFLGTHAYPDESEFGEFLATHGGGANAFTALEHTNYYFHVASDAFLPASHRFAQFFIAPLFTSDVIQRELHAIDSEHGKNLLNDDWRVYQLFKHVAAPESVLNGFSTGNLNSLDKPGVRAAMLAFHAAHYHAGNMRVCLYASLSLDDLQKHAESVYGEIPSVARVDSKGETKEMMDAAIASVAAASTRMQAEMHARKEIVRAFPHPDMLVFAVPLTRMHVVTLVFPLPPADSCLHSRTHVHTLVHALLGDEGEGSLYAFLSAARLASSVAVGSFVDTAFMSSLQVDVTLTESAVAPLYACGNSTSGAGERGECMRNASRVITFALASSVVTYASLALADARAAVAFAENAAASAELKFTSCGRFPANASTGDVISWPFDAAVSATSRVWDELLRSDAFEFAHPDAIASASSFASSLAGQLHRCSSGEAVLGDPATRVWAPHALVDVLEHVRADNMIAIVRSSAFDSAGAHDHEPIYGTAYTLQHTSAHEQAYMVSHMPDCVCSASQPCMSLPSLALPPPNSYIPAEADAALIPAALYVNASALVHERTSVQAAAEALQLALTPSLLSPLHDIDDGGMDWWLPHTLFASPLVHASVWLDVHAHTRDTRGFVLMQVFTRAVTQAMRTALYPARRAGADMSVTLHTSVHPHTLQLSWTAAARAADMLAGTFTTAVLSPASTLTCDAIMTALHDYVTDIRNARAAAVYMRTYTHAHTVLRAREHGEADLLNASLSIAYNSTLGASLDELMRESRDTVAGATVCRAVIAAAQQLVCALTNSSVRTLVYGNADVPRTDALRSRVRAAVAAASSSSSANVACVPPTISCNCSSSVRIPPVGRSLLQLHNENDNHDRNGAMTLLAYAGSRDGNSRLPMQAFNASGHVHARVLSHHDAEGGEHREVALRAHMRSAARTLVGGNIGAGSSNSSNAAHNLATVHALTQLLHTHAFDELRTKQSLGYVVFAHPHLVSASAPSGGCACVPRVCSRSAGCIVNSSHACLNVSADAHVYVGITVSDAATSSVNADEAVSAWLLTYPDMLRTYSDPATWRDVIEGVRAGPAARIVPASSLALFESVRDEIRARTYAFTRSLHVARALNNVTPADITQLFERIFLSPTQKQTLAVHIVGDGHAMRQPTGAATPDHVVPFDAAAGPGW